MLYNTGQELCYCFC